MNITDNKNRSFLFFDYFIRVLAVLHWGWLLSYRYFYFDSTKSHRLPIFSFLEHNSPLLHGLVFALFTIATLLFAFRKRNYIWSFILASCFFYFEFHDKYSFHQDIFLAINVYFLFGLAKYAYLKEQLKNYKIYIFLLKFLCASVYFFAAFHKFNSSFHSGLLLNDILIHGPLGKFTTEIPISISKFIAVFTFILELLFPFFIWTKYKKSAVIAAIFLHVGIVIFGMRGLLFNLYLPALWILFFNYAKISVVDQRFKTLYSKLDFFKTQNEVVTYKKMKLGELISFLGNSMILNPIFICCLGAFAFSCLVVFRNLFKLIY